MTGTTVGNHLNTRVFLVAFQLCIRNGCNQVVNNMRSRYNRYCDGKEDIICIFRNSHTEFIFAYNSESSFFKSSFSSLFSLRKILLATRSCCKSVLQAPLYKLMTVPAHGHLSTRLIQTSISKSMLFFRIFSLTFPFCIQEPLSVEGTNVFAYASAKQPF